MSDTVQDRTKILCMTIVIGLLYAQWYLIYGTFVVVLKFVDTVCHFTVTFYIVI